MPGITWSPRDWVKFSCSLFLCHADHRVYFLRLQRREAETLQVWTELSAQEGQLPWRVSQTAEDFLAKQEVNLCGIPNPTSRVASGRAGLRHKCGVMGWGSGEAVSMELCTMMGSQTVEWAA